MAYTGGPGSGLGSGGRGRLDSRPDIPTPQFGAGGRDWKGMSPFIGQALGGLFGMGSYNNPADAASPYLDEASRKQEQYFNPYIDAGRRTDPYLEEQYRGMTGRNEGLEREYDTQMNDPGSIMARLGKGYTSSPGYQFRVDEATRGANQAAAAGGMVGSPAEQAELSKYITGLAGQDFDSYLQKAMSLYGNGMSGRERSVNRGFGGLDKISGRGYDASKSLADNLKDLLESQAKLKYEGQNNQNQSEGGGWGNILGSAAAIAPYFL